jgi:uncharacterized membrane protein YdbT with pleckstrin-like domain
MENPHPQPRAREEVVWQGHPSWKGMLGWYFRWTGAAVFISAVAWWLTSHSLAVVWAVLITLITIGGTMTIGYVLRRATTYQITTQNISETMGIIGTRTEKTTMNHIVNVVISRSLPERMLGIGRVNFDTAGEKFSNRDLFDWWGVPNPYAVEEIVNMYRFDEDSSAID